MSLNFLTKSMWEGKKWIIPGYLISGDTRYSRQLCVCVWITTDTGLAFVPYVLFSLVYPYLTYVCYLVSRQERKGERIYSSNAMCNIIYACVTSHVQNHACSESLSNIHVVDLRLWKYLFYVNNFTLMVYVR